MDALIFDTDRTRVIPYITFGDIHNDIHDDNSNDSDNILEDIFVESPNERNIDYSIFPPEIGKSVTVNELGLEIPSLEISSVKRALCFFTSNCDSDEYPFNAVSYGESGSLFGLDYNDHNYFKLNEISNKNSHDDSDHLSLLAKLALSKHENQSPTASIRYGNSLFRSGPQNEVSVDTKNIYQKDDHISPISSQLSFVRCPSVIISSSRILPGSGAVTTASSKLTSQNRTILFSSGRTSQNVPLHFQRVSQTGAPHILLRPQTNFISNVNSRRLTSFTSPLNIRCICNFTHDDGCLVQCDKCKIWQHGECVTTYPSTPFPTTYYCEICNPRTLRVAEAIFLQRRKLQVSGNVENSLTCTVRPSQKLPNFRLPNGQFCSTSNNSSSLQATSRIPVALGSSGSCAGTVQVRLAAPPSATASESLLRQRRPVVNNATEYTFFTFQPNHGIPNHYYRFGLNRNNPLQQVTNQAIGTFASNSVGSQSRTSKRKQDLYNCVGARDSLANLGHPILNNDLGVYSQQPTSPNHAIGENNVPNLDLVLKPTQTGLVDNLCSGPLGNSFDLSVDQLLSVSGSSVSLTTSPGSGLNYNNDNTTRTVDSIGFEADTYSYEASYHDIRLTDRLQIRLVSLLGSEASTSQLDDDSVLSNLSKYPPRFRVVSSDFNRKGLIATHNLFAWDAIIEFRGMFMLLDEYTELHDYRRHYNPFALFYKQWDKLSICVDAKDYGNEARFIRRSCEPNCEVRHIVSTTNQNNLSNRHSTQLTTCLRLVIFSTQVISAGTELTIPFDFDPTACQYPVRCACSGRACSLSRANQLNGLSGRPSKTFVSSVSIVTSSSSGTYTSPTTTTTLTTSTATTTTITNGTIGFGNKLSNLTGRRNFKAHRLDKFLNCGHDQKIVKSPLLSKEHNETSFDNTTTVQTSPILNPIDRFSQSVGVAHVARRRNEHLSTKLGMHMPRSIHRARLSHSKTGYVVIQQAA